MALTSNFPSYPEKTRKKKTAVHCAMKRRHLWAASVFLGRLKERSPLIFRKNPELAAGRNQRRKEFICDKA